MAGLGAWLGLRSRGLKGYFLGESNIPAWAVMISIVATETSTATFLSVPGVAYTGDFTYLQLAFGYLFGRVVVAAVLLPAYFRGRDLHRVSVAPGSVRRPDPDHGLAPVPRGSVAGRRPPPLPGGDVLQHLTGWSVGTAIVAVAAVTVVYTFLGGMKAVIWTDVIQFSVYILGASWHSRSSPASSPAAGPSFSHRPSGGQVPASGFLVRPDPPFTFWAGLIGGMVLNTATHGADQMMVQPCRGQPNGPKRGLPRMVYADSW